MQNSFLSRSNSTQSCLPAGPCLPATKEELVFNAHVVGHFLAYVAVTVDINVKWCFLSEIDYHSVGFRQWPKYADTFLNHYRCIVARGGSTRSNEPYWAKEGVANVSAVAKLSKNLRFMHLAHYQLIISSHSLSYQKHVRLTFWQP